MKQNIKPEVLEAWLSEDDDLVILDLREEEAYGAEHIFFAVNLPMSKFESHATRLFPRPSARIVVVDDLPHLTAWGIATLKRAGYSALYSLEGGTRAWADRGRPTFSGVNVPSKTLGEEAERVYRTPHIDAATLARRISEGDRIQIVDCRTPEEYAEFNIPGAVNVPGTELVPRIRSIVKDRETSIVVHCAGRTRSIIGAQSLIDVGLPNPVYALENGTIGWKLTGLTFEVGATPPVRKSELAGPNWGLEAARAVAARHHVELITDAELMRYWNERGDRAIFVFDVSATGPSNRDPVRRVAGAELVQATDRHVGSRGARVILFDPAQTRALMAASWLKRMGYAHAGVLSSPVLPEFVGKTKSSLPSKADDIASKNLLSADMLQTQIDRGEVAVWDLGNSLAYAAGHIPGAKWLSRAALSTRAAKAPSNLVLTHSDTQLLYAATVELIGMGCPTARALEGGTDAWSATGRPLTSENPEYLSTPDDVHDRFYYRPNYQDLPGVEDEMRAYIAWELDLSRRLSMESPYPFKL